MGQHLILALLMPAAFLAALFAVNTPLLADGSPTAYTSNVGYEHFGYGDTVGLSNTTLFEGERTFNVMLSDPVNATMGSVSVSRVIINEDEHGIFLPVIARP
ncbi:MAG: hypothetical protein Q9O62_06850 [Ardenticatenia bacterium]|nr:hypothetical protein [Ardenticatenia bacterium]